MNPADLKVVLVIGVVGVLIQGSCCTLWIVLLGRYSLRRSYIRGEDGGLVDGEERFEEIVVIGESGEV